jgi:hypothetical protein
MVSPPTDSQIELVLRVRAHLNIVRSVDRDRGDNSTVRESRQQPLVLEAIEDRLRRRSRQVEADEWDVAEALTGSERTPQGQIVHANQRENGL